MTSRKIQVIVSDLDGTLAGANRKIFESTLNDLKGWLDQGGAFAVATARPVSYLEHIFEPDLFRRIWKICHNGAQLFGPDAEIHFRHSIDAKIQFDFLAKLGRGYRSLSWYCGDTWYSDAGFCDDIRAVYGIDANYPAPVPSNMDDLAANDVEKILVVEATNSDALIEAFADKLSIHKSRTEDLIMVSSGTSDKAGATAALLALQGCDWANALAIGDDLNDASMIQSAGLGIAVAEAPRDLKNMADLVVGSHDDPATFQRVFELARGV